jgi:Protein of unknown function (DUF2934)
MTRKRVSENQVAVSSAAAAPARRKSASPKRVARPSTVGIYNTPAAEPEVPSVEPAAAVPEEAVARLAYEYAEARGFVGGSPEEDWLRAEQELRATYTMK